MHQFQPGDQFYILTDAEWGDKPRSSSFCAWVVTMDKYKGKTLTVEAVSSNNNPLAEGWYFPNTSIRYVPPINLYF